MVTTAGKRKFNVTLLLFTLLLVGLFFTVLPKTAVFSDAISDYEKQIELTNKQKAEKEKILNQTKAEIDKIMASGASLDQKIAMLNKSIAAADADIKKAESELVVKQKELEVKEKDLTEKKAKITEISSSLYKSSRVSILEMVLSQDDPDVMLRSVSYRKYVLQAQMAVLRDVNNQFDVLNLQKQEIENNKVILNEQKAALETSKQGYANQKAIIQQQYAQKAASQTQLNKEISSLKSTLSSLQKKLTEARAGTTYVDSGSVPATGEYIQTLAGFRSTAPANSFAVFSIGAYTHRNGMSQYGAYQRAKEGQSAAQIIQNYYKKAPTSVNTSGTISVQGYGNLDFETTYLYGVSEMTSSWPLEALKAQAIAARSYAYNGYKIVNRTICTTQSCQAFSMDKSRNVAAWAPRWKQAVDETRGLIMQGVVTSQYSAVSGGWLNTSGWDTTDKTNSGDWMARSYESRSGSPWFYRSWYRASYNDSSATCGRKPWMSMEEMSDILNAYLVMQKIDVKGSPDTSRIIPVTIKSCPVGGVTGNPYTMAELKNFLTRPVTSITTRPVVVNDNRGNSQTVIFQTNRGEVRMSAAQFKAIFHTRAPGYLRIPQSGFAFFNIEMK